MQTEVHWDLEGRPKPRNTGTTPLLYYHFHVLELPIQKLTFLKFCTLKFCSLYFRIASCEIYENLHHSKISRYTVMRSNLEIVQMISGLCNDLVQS